MLGRVAVVRAVGEAANTLLMQSERISSASDSGGSCSDWVEASRRILHRQTQWLNTRTSPKRRPATELTSPPFGIRIFPSRRALPSRTYCM